MALTIGQFASEVGLSVSAVRFYADRGLLIPSETDESSGYRYFDIEQVPIGRLVRDLRTIDMSLRSVAAVLEMTPAEREVAVHAHIESLERQLDESRKVAQELGLDREIDRVGTGGTAVGTNHLQTAIRQVLPAAGRNPADPHLMCVRVEVKDGSLRLVATDRHRLVVSDLVATSVGRSFSIVVAAASLEDWANGLTGLGPIVTIESGDGLLTANGDGASIRCHHVPIDFPDYEPLLDRSVDLTATIALDRRELLASLEAFDGSSPVILGASRAKLSITRSGVERTAAADVRGAAEPLAVNPAYAIDAVANAVGSEVVIEVGTTLSPLVFRSADDGTYVSLLMPFKLD